MLRDGVHALDHPALVTCAATPALGGPQRFFPVPVSAA